ncbi:MAG: PEGA domain-containing protein [Patescibacteria group bacterium]
MHLALRRVIFAIFLLIFLIGAPTIVFYTAGYRLIIANRHIQRTGALAINTQPRGSSIVLNGQDLAQKSPYVVQRIMPNTHSVTLTKKGYHDWSQRVQVDEGKTTYISTRLFADAQPTLLNAANSALALRAKPSHVEPLDDASIHFINNGANVEVRTGSVVSSQLIALLPLSDYTLLEEDADYIILANEHLQAYVIQRDGGNVVELPTKITAFDWLDDKHALVWTDGSEVNIYDAISQERTFITREGNYIADVAWHPEADSFFVVSGDSIQAYDMAVHATRSVTQLLSDTPVLDIWLDAAGKNLYFLDSAPTNTTDTLFVNQLPLTL